MTINALIKINGTEITEHNRKFNAGFQNSYSDVNLAAGNKRRFVKPSRETFDFNWTYLPNRADKSVDLRASSDFLRNIVKTNSLVQLSIQENHTGEWVDYSCVVMSYSQVLIRNDIANQCKYYNISIQLSSV